MAQRVVIVDGAPTGAADIENTVFDKTNSNPLAVALVDEDGSQITSVGITDGTDTADVIDSGTYAGVGAYILDGSGDPITSFGGGTQYTEDVITANPQVGTATLIERDDVITTVTPAEGDWIGLRGSAEGALWVQDFNSDAILADTNTIAGAVAGTEMQVDVITSALPTGAATAANQLPDGHNVTVDNASIAVTGTFWQATQPISAAALPLPTGASTLAEQQTQTTALQLIDDPVATIGTTPLQRVAIFDATDSQITSFGGGTQYTEDAVAAADPIGTAQILIAESTPALEVAEDDNVARRGTRYGAAYSQIVDSSGNFVDTFGGGTQYTEDDAVPANPVGTALMMERDDVLGGITPAAGDWTHPFANANGALWVKHDGAQAVTGTFYQVTQPISAAALPLPAGASTSALQLPDGHNVTIDNASIPVTGNVANDAADSGNPVKIGGKASDAMPSDVADNDRVNATFTQKGVQKVTRPYGSPVSAKTNVTTAGTQVALGSGIVYNLKIKAKTGNVGFIYLGGSSVSSVNGRDMLPGEEVNLDYANLALVYIDSDINGEGVSFYYET